MTEQRLIDANALREDWLENGENEYVYDTNSFLSSLDDAPTIDPETLPIVRQLREELARVTAERNEYKELFFSYKHVCGGVDPKQIEKLVEADKAWRAKILPVYTGKVCGTCGHFLRIVGTCRGKCAVKPLASSRYGIWNTPFEPSQSRKACKQYEPQKEE